MNALTQPIETPAGAAATPLLRTLVACDLVDSTALVERLGDHRAAELMRRHDRVVRALLPTHGGREIDKTDGFLAMFDRPIQAVAFALAYQRGLRRLNEHEGTQLAARVGVHVGDVMTWDNSAADVAKGAKLTEVEGLVKPTTSRLMQLALPGQILLSGVAYDIAHRAQGELGELLQTVRWRTHGRYRFKGIPDPIPVFEVGEEGHAPLKPPPWSGKAHREVPFWRRPATVGIEAVLLLALVAIPTWYLLRPAPAIAFANRDWVVVGDLKNLTTAASFNDSLETAFRIGLEQSRYVNVMSDLKTRETIKLMQRDPEQTKVDRSIGSEVAIRDGARALILPTVAEIGGRVRVTAEVIDPQTQTTVYSESADGIGEGSVLPSLDKVNQRLRVRLGEALATVSNESRSLDKVATKNLDALRMYSLAEHAYDVRKYPEALSLYREALKTDPDFALAHVGLGRTLLVAGEKEQALDEFNLARQGHDRLAPRDAKFVDAWQASLIGSQKSALEKWKLLATIYPDFFAAQGLYAYFAWQFANRYDDEIINAARAAASPNNPYAPTSQLLLGSLDVANEKFEEASKEFSDARSGGLSWHVDYVLADAAQRRFESAFATLDKAVSSGLPSTDIDATIRRVVLNADSGRWADTRQSVETAKKEAAVLDAAAVNRVALVELCLKLSLEPTSVNADWVNARFSAVIAAADKATPANAADAKLDAAYIAYWAARRGEIEISVRAEAAARAQEFPVIQKMLAIAAAERLRVAGKANEAISSLRAMLDGTELYATHVSLMDAYAAAGDMSPAIEQAQWLSAHRGRAYAEYDQQRVFFNVLQSDLASLNSAEYAATLGRRSESAKAQESFHAIWPDIDGQPFLSSRIKALRTKS